MGCQAAVSSGHACLNRPAKRAFPKGSTLCRQSGLLGRSRPLRCFTTVRKACVASIGAVQGSHRDKDKPEGVLEPDKIAVSCWPAPSVPTQSVLLHALSFAGRAIALGLLTLALVMSHAGPCWAGRSGGRVGGSSFSSARASYGLGSRSSSYSSSSRSSTTSSSTSSASRSTPTTSSGARTATATGAKGGGGGSRPSLAAPSSFISSGTSRRSSSSAAPSSAAKSTTASPSTTSKATSSPNYNKSTTTSATKPSAVMGGRAFNAFRSSPATKSSPAPAKPAAPAASSAPAASKVYSSSGTTPRSSSSYSPAYSYGYSAPSSSNTTVIVQDSTPHFDWNYWNFFSHQPSGYYHAPPPPSTSSQSAAPAGAAATAAASPASAATNRWWDWNLFNQKPASQEDPACKDATRAATVQQAVKADQQAAAVKADKTASATKAATKQGKKQSTDLVGWFKASGAMGILAALVFLAWGGF